MGGGNTLRPRVFLTHSPSDLGSFFPRPALERLRSFADVTTNPSEDHLSTSELLGAAPDSHFVITEWATGADAAYFERNRSLIALARVGVEILNVDIPAATANGVLIVNLPGIHATSVVELTLGYMIMSARKAMMFDHGTKVGNFPIAYNVALGLGHDMPEPGFDIKGSTVGLVGIGYIGAGLARLLMLMGARVIAYDPYATAVPDGVELVPLDDLLARSDIVSLHAKLTPETENIIGARELELMRPTSYLINTARGGLVDNVALAKALHDSTIAGAAVDVFDTEPQIAGHPLLSAPNCITTPHMTGNTVATMLALAEGAVDAVYKLSSGELPTGIVNPEVLESAALRWRKGVDVA